MKPAKCPFYPDSCTVEFHPNMQHVWRKDMTPIYGPFETVDELIDALEADAQKTITNIPKAPKITNKASERAQAWNKANRKQYNARQKLLMAGKRAKRGG